MAGMAATATIAKSAANNISFFNFTPPYERVFMDVAYSFIHIPYCQYLKCSFFLLFLKKLNIVGTDGEAEISRRISPDPPHVVPSIRSQHESPEGIGAAEDRRSTKRRRTLEKELASSLAATGSRFRGRLIPLVRLPGDLAEKEAAGHQQGAGAGLGAGAGAAFGAGAGAAFGAGAGAGAALPAADAAWLTSCTHSVELPGLLVMLEPLSSNSKSSASESDSITSVTPWELPLWPTL